MNHHPGEEQLALYLTGDLPAQELQTAAEHLENCPVCQQAMSDFEASQSMLARLGAEPTERDLIEVRRRVIRQLLSRRWAWPVAVAASVALIWLLPLNRPSAVTPAPAKVLVKVQPRTAPLLPAEPVKAARAVLHHSAAGLRSVALITPVDQPPLIKMNTSDPNVVILLQTGEMKSDERMETNE